MNWYVFWLKPVFNHLEGKFILKTLKKIIYGVFLPEVSIGFYILVFLPWGDSYVLEPQTELSVHLFTLTDLEARLANHTLSREHSKPSRSTLRWWERVNMQSYLIPIWKWFAFSTSENMDKLIVLLNNADKQKWSIYLQTSLAYQYSES